MKIIASRVDWHATKSALSGRQPPVPRTSYARVSVIRLSSSPLQRLAWIFGFGR